MSRNLGVRLKSLARVVAKRFPLPPTREMSDAEFVWWLARFVHRVKERLASPEAEWPRLRQRYRQEDESLHLTHPHFKQPAVAAGGPVDSDANRKAAAVYGEWLTRRAAREVNPDALDLSAEDRQAVVEAVRKVEAELNLPLLSGGPIVYTDDELCPFLAPDVYLRVVAAQAKLMAARANGKGVPL
jgi:hypothetical protein